MRELAQLLHHGDSFYQMMQVSGEERVTLADYVTYLKSLFFDLAYLQLDAYDKVDVSVPLERQKLALMRELVQRDYPFGNKEEAYRFFTQLTDLLRISTRGAGTPGVFGASGADQKTCEHGRRRRRREP